MGSLFTQLLFRPLLNAVIFVYNILPWHDFGLSIVVVTVLVRLALSPLSLRALRSNRAIADVQPHVEEIKQKHKGDKAAQAQAIMGLYKERKISPFGGCLPLLLQLPILIALYRVFLVGIKPESLNLLYSFVAHPSNIQTTSFGILDLAGRNMWMAILAGISQFIFSKLSANQTPSQSKEMAAMNKQMLYFFPILIIIITWNQPAGLALYWVTTTLFSICEQMYIRKLA